MVVFEVEIGLSGRRLVKGLWFCTGIVWGEVEWLEGGGWEGLG